MEKYIIQMKNRITGIIEDDKVDDMIFDSEEEAEDYVCELNSCAAQGREDLQLRDPFGYEGYNLENIYEFLIVEI